MKSRKYFVVCAMLVSLFTSAVTHANPVGLVAKAVARSERAASSVTSSVKAAERNIFKSYPNDGYTSLPTIEQISYRGFHASAAVGTGGLILSSDSLDLLGRKRAFDGLVNTLQAGGRIVLPQRGMVDISQHLVEAGPRWLEAEELLGRYYVKIGNCNFGEHYSSDEIASKIVRWTRRQEFDEQALKESNPSSRYSEFYSQYHPNADQLFEKFSNMLDSPINRWLLMHNSDTPRSVSGQLLLDVDQVSRFSMLHQHTL